MVESRDEIDAWSPKSKPSSDLAASRNADSIGQNDEGHLQGMYRLRRSSAVPERISSRPGMGKSKQHNGR